MEAIQGSLPHYSFEDIVQLFEEVSLSQQKDVELLENEKNRSAAFDIVAATHKLFYEAVNATTSLDQEHLSQIKLRVGAYTDQFGKMIPKLASLFVNHLEELDMQIQTMMERKIKDNDALVGDLPREEILVNCARIALSQQDNWKGFFWEVPTEHTTHYLIGTVHPGMPKMLESSNFNLAIDRSQVFYAESELNEKVRKIANESFQALGYAFNLDILLIESLMKSEKEIKSLESLESQIACATLLSLSEIILKIPYGGALMYQAARIWQLGDEKQAEAIVAPKDTFAPKDLAVHTAILDDRTENWCAEHGLPDLLKTSDQPICIFVGYGHFFGDHGLLKIFRDNGLNINRME
jgi:uncharacterized protein YbaP (TraB family)